MTAPQELTADPHQDGVDAAVTAARRVIESLLRAGSGSTAEMGRIADQLNSVADNLDEHAPAMNQRMVDMWAGEGTTRHDPVTGPENAIAPPLQLIGQSDGSVRGVLTLGLPYQGPPGHVHGGISALILDHTLGVANHWAGVSGMTAELTLRYHRPTPLFEPLTITGVQTGVDGRKIRTSGAVTAGGEVCVSAEGLFIAKHLPRPR
ncbi:Thioesterase superfamily protein [Saccharopolyspora antimicrobica]|uniref:Acyl-coenzyme A thioesterase THEM4 n=1 Tax=Saccharopolyspora antimicrobica TaxID=455193 RepID=A0A1I5JZ17_9PSEU|nr:PaaI family thioesterase [Saccharopolyspora antimicrobica]RKT87010.1 thioesterase superfamily protein [Saccharopolyspora antimicrobica]SFO77999.1 Thioesterase superfamily protein [Saccharopolyspora antimicrobica]